MEPCRCISPWSIRHRHRPRSRVASRSPIPREVLERCKARDPMAFRAFVVRYERAVFALLSRLVGRGPHVEDLPMPSRITVSVSSSPSRSDAAALGCCSSSDRASRSSCVFARCRSRRVRTRRCIALRTCGLACSGRWSTHVALLVDLAALDERVVAEHVLHRAAQAGAAVDDDEDRTVGGHAARDEVGEQRPARGRVLRRAFADARARASCPSSRSRARQRGVLADAMPSTMSATMSSSPSGSPRPRVRAPRASRHEATAHRALARAARGGDGRATAPASGRTSASPRRRASARRARSYSGACQRV